MNGRERIIACLEGRSSDCLPRMPITMMFATDLIEQPYGKYATDYRVLVEGQLRTAELFDFDYVSCISDPAREAADCGAKVEYFENQPPAIVESQAVLADKSRLAKLQPPDPLAGERMLDRIRAAELFRKRVGGDKLIEGWIEGPCAESADLRGINTLMVDFMDDPAFVADLFEFTVQLGLRFARAQIDAGCDLIGIGDAAASLISKRTYEQTVWPYEKRLIEGVQQMGAKVRLHICGKTTHILPAIGRLNADLVDIDFLASLTDARAAMGDRQVLAGNLDPVRTVRDGNPSSIQNALAECYRQAGRAYVVAAGCEIPRDTPHDNVRAMVDFAKAMKR